MLSWPQGADWAADTDGGRGGEIIPVTTLDADGEGSLRAALEAEGPRIVVFEVGGVIDLDGQAITIDDPDLTVAGQTAPSPGVTIIRGGLVIAADDVIVQHLRIRPGDFGEDRMSGRDIDAISTNAASNVIVDHCTLTWATDENLSASGPRFDGENPDGWRQGASNRITFSHNLIAEGLSHATHAKGEHSKGSLIHDNTDAILLYGNLYAHNVERSPLFKGGVRGAVANNFIYNPGQRAIHYNLQGLEWGEVPAEDGHMSVVGNVMRHGPDTWEGLPLVMIGGDGDLELYARGNLSVDRMGEPVEALTGRYTTSAWRIIESDAPRRPLDGLDLLNAEQVEPYVLASAGARPWDRDAHDVRVFADIAEGRGAIIDSQEEVGGYPDYPETRREFDPDLWDLDTMTPVDPGILDDGSSARGT